MDILQIPSSSRCLLASTNLPHSSSLYSLGTDRIENSVSNSFSIVVVQIVSVGPCLFAKVLLSNGCVYLLIKNVLPSSDVVSLIISRSSPSNGSLYATIYDYMNEIIDCSLCSVMNTRFPFLPLFLKSPFMRLDICFY
jgi:hypothetical protein